MPAVFPGGTQILPDSFDRFVCLLQLCDSSEKAACSNCRPPSHTVVAKVEYAYGAGAVGWVLVMV